MQQEFQRLDTTNNEEETDFQQIYNVKIWTITLRELLLINSLYLAKTLSDIVELVKD